MENKLKQKEITREMRISDIVLLYPEVIPILLDSGVNCVGCNASSFETAEDGFRSHGMSEQDISSAITKMNEKISSKETGPFQISSFAAEKLSAMLKSFDSSYGLRLSVLRGGCAGFTYGMELGKKEPENLIVEQEGVRVFIDKESMGLLLGSRLEYIDSLQGAGFRISNPNMKEGSGCACGSSFNLR